jgi:hypothetical protein
MFDTATAPEFAEGTLDLASGVWFCADHQTSIKVGQECAFCVHDELGPDGFDQWASRF